MSGRLTGISAAVSTFCPHAEVDYEHGHTPQSYTLEYDAIVLGIRRWLGPRADNIT